MASNEVQELLNRARDAGNTARGDNSTLTKPKKSLFRSLVSDYLVDLGEDDTATTPASDATLEHPTIASIDFDTSGDVEGKSLTEIYTEAGITSAFSVDDFEAMLNSDKIKSQPITMKQVAVPFALEAMGVTIDVPITDAAKRDAALDSYAESLLSSTTSAVGANKQKEATIDAEMKSYFESKQAEIETIRQDTVNKEAAYRGFLDRKREEEERMVRIISPFLNGQANPVSVGGEPVPTEAKNATAK